MKRKVLTIVLSFFVSVWFFGYQADSAEMHLAVKPKPCKFLTAADAEKILGQPVRLIENNSEIVGDIHKTRCAYTGISKDKISGKDINLSFSLEQKEQNPTVEQAQQMFKSAYRKIDEPELSVQVLSGIGDEAFSISNPGYFHFIMVRKGEIIFRIKMNKAAENTSFEELKAFAKKLAEQI